MNEIKNDELVIERSIIEVPPHLMARADLSPTDKLICIALTMVSPLSKSVGNLARFTAITEKEVTASVGRLLELGLVRGGEVTS